MNPPEFFEEEFNRLWPRWVSTSLPDSLVLIVSSVAIMDEDFVSESPGRAAVLQAQASLFSPSSWKRSAEELRGYHHNTPAKMNSKKGQKKPPVAEKDFQRDSRRERSKFMPRALHTPCTSLFLPFS